MSNPGYRWVIVAAGGLLGCVAIGGLCKIVMAAAHCVLQYSAAKTAPRPASIKSQ